MRGNKRLTALTAAIAVILLIAVVIGRHTVSRVFVSQVISVATGYHVEIGEMRLQSDHGAFLNAHVSKHGEPVLDAARIDVYYHLRDLLPGSSHRFGFSGISINQPKLTIIHHKDGTYNVAQGAIAGNAAPPGQARTNAVPLDYTARIRNGSATLIDEYQYYKEARLQSVRNINVDLAVKSDVRTHYVMTAQFVEQPKDEPIRAVGTIDYHHGYAIHHISAAAIPIQAIGNYIINSPAARIVAGTARAFDARIYALDVTPGMPIQYHTSGTTELSRAQIYVNGLAKPLDNLRGTLQITDSSLAARSLSATMAGVPIAVAGAIYDFADPQFYLGVQGQGDLRDLKSIVAFGARYPLSGQTTIRTLIEGSIVKPLVLVGFSAAAVRFDAYPLKETTGLIALYNNIASVVPLRGKYGGIDLNVRGNLTLGPHVDSQIALSYSANAADLPYIGALVPGSAIAGEAILAGTDTALGVSGDLADPNDPQRISATYSLTPQGTGTIGPIEVNRNGGSLVASYVLDRPHNSSAFWISAQNLDLASMRIASLPGAKLPQLPQLAGRITDAEVAGGGAANDVTVGGRVQLGAMQVAGVPLYAASADFAGPLANLSINKLHANGPWGRFDGDGSYDGNGVIARGDFHGTVDSLPFAAASGIRGGVNGPVALAMRGSGVILQMQGTQFTNASVRGIPVQSLSGTIALENGNVRVYSASGQIAGAHAVAAGALGANNSVAISTADAGPEMARALGVPLEDGRVALNGNLGQQGAIQTFDGGIAVSNGRVSGYSVSGSSEMHLNGDVLQVQNAGVTVAGTYSALNGSVSALRSGAPAYNLTANVPAGDIASASHTLKFPTFGTVGSFGANLAVGGRGGAPNVRGPLWIPAGQVNGLDFGNAHAAIAADSGGMSARHGDVVVGSTHATFDASVRGHNSAVSVRAMHSDLSDFNNYFDTGDTLAGHGNVSFSVVRTAQTISSAGDVSVVDFRYRRLPIGNTDADWASRDGIVVGNLRVGGVHGILSASGSIGLAPASTMAQIVSRSRYDITAQLHALDLTTWLPALGYPTVPMTGHVDATATVHGRYPQLALTSEVTMRNGTFGRAPVDLLHVIARSSGSRIALTHMDLQIPALVASGTGTFGLGKRDPINFNMQAQSDNLPILAANFTKTPLDVHGLLQTQLNIGGSWAAPRVTAGVDLTKAVVHGIAVPQLVASLALHGSNVEVRNAEVTFAKGRVAIAGALPLQLNPFGIGPPAAPFSMDFFSQALDMSDFNPVAPAGTKLGGVLDGHVGVNGTVSAPQIRGSLAVADGTYVSAFETVPITQTVAHLVFGGTKATVDTLHARLGAGTLDAKGVIAFDRGANGTQVAYTADATTKGASLHFPAYGSGTLDSKLHLSKTAGALARLSGDVTITDAVIPFAALIGRGAASTDINASPAVIPFNLGFDLNVTAGKNVAVRASALGFGVDIGAKGHVLLAGTMEQPTLSGAFNAAGGTLTFVDHVFKVQEGSVTFDPANGVIPQLYAVGTTHVINPDPNNQRNPGGSADVTIKVTGMADNPQLSFSSDPGGYSRDQIIAMLTPLGAISGIQFDEFGNPVEPGTLRGAPPAGNAQPLPPGAVRRTNGTLSVGQEAFNILNAQFAHSLLTPLENALGGTLGLSNVNLTLDYTGAVGVSLRRPISKKVSAVYASTFGYPQRQTYGFQYSPNEFTAAQLTFFQQNTATSFFSSGTSAITTNPNVTVGQPIGGSSGFTLTIQRLFP